MANPGCGIVVAGGSLRRSDGGHLGEMTTRFFKQFKGDFAVTGCSAFDPDGDLLDFDLSGVRVSRSILGQARRRFVVADHGKPARSAPARIASLSEVDGFFTGRALPDVLQTRREAWGTAVHVSGPAG